MPTAYKGYNGSIVVDEDTLTITHSGLVAKGGGLKTDQPRAIPVQAISGVRIKDASRMTNGWLTLGLGGAPAPQLQSKEAPSNADSIMFRYKDREMFSGLAQWLQQVIDANQAAGVDPSTVEFDAAAETRTEKQERKQAESRLSQAESLVGDERQDILDAAARMGWKLGGKRELKNLAGHLHDGEAVRFIAQGTYENDQGIVVLTDLRLLFLFHGMVSQRKEDFPLRNIASVQTKSGMVTGELTIFVSGNSARIKGIVKNDLQPLADAVREGMARMHASAAALPPMPTEAAPAAEDPYEAMHKLAKLRDAGLLNEEEFEAKRKELLDRM
jgi:Bacterial PH domain/Short C-terminal domain/Domain of unknown function (DUF4429)